jgi:hypothetical protein
MSSTPADREGKEFLVSFSFALGPKLYGELKDLSEKEIVERLEYYAGRSAGPLRDMFLLMSKYHGLLPLVPLRATPFPGFADGTGGCNVQVGTNGCGECSDPPNGINEYVNGVFQGCIQCPY